MKTRILATLFCQAFSFSGFCQSFERMMEKYLEAASFFRATARSQQTYTSLGTIAVAASNFHLATNLTLFPY